MEAFKYQPLDLKSSAFRLIRLLKGPAYSDIECQLIYTTLDENVIEYEAISYTWGTSVKAFSIKLDGAKFMITPNLWHLLGNIRKVEEDRYLWVDAIAINQDDSSERGHQVQRMQAIYSGANCVIIYLGAETASISILMESLLLVQRYTRGCRWESDDERWKGAWKNVRLQHHRAKDAQQGLREVLKRPWFRRVWILQEVANARRALVFCGSTSVRAQIFAMAPTFLEVDLDSYAAAVFRLMPTGSGMIPRETRGRKFHSLLLDFRGSEASDPRDKIFALLGLCKEECAKEWIIPDYTQAESDIIYTTVCFIGGVNGTRPVLKVIQLLTEAIPFLSPIQNLIKHIKQGKSSQQKKITMLQTEGQLRKIHRLLAIIAPSLSDANQLMSRAKHFQSQAVQLLFVITQLLSGIQGLSTPTFKGLSEKIVQFLSEAKLRLSELRYLPPGLSISLIGRCIPSNTDQFLFTLACSQDGFMTNFIPDILSTWGVKDLQSFLHRREREITITFDMVKAALSNNSDARGTLNLLLCHGSLRWPISPSSSGLFTNWFHILPHYFSGKLDRMLEGKATVPVYGVDLFSLLFFSSHCYSKSSILGMDDIRVWGYNELIKVLTRLQQYIRDDCLGIWNQRTIITAEISRLSLGDRAGLAEVVNWPLLLLAIAAGEVDIAERLLEMQPGAFSTPCESANLAFTLAIDSPNESLGQRLLDNGAKIMVREYEEWELPFGYYYDPLSSLYGRDTKFANSCRSHPTSIVAPPYLETTPLHIAVKRRDKRLAQFLVEQGADLRATDGHGQTALDLARQVAFAGQVRYPENPMSPNDASDCFSYLLAAETGTLPLES